MLLIVITAFILSGFFLSRNISITGSKEIHSQPYKVYQQIYDLKNWNNWCIWLNDSTLNHLKLEKTNNVALNQISFYNENLGNCSIKTLDFKPFDSLSFLAEFNKFGNASIHFTIQEKKSAVYLGCTFSSDLGKNPLNRWISLFFRKKLQTDLDNNLDNIAEYIDNQPYKEIEPVETLLPQRFMLYDTVTISASKTDSIIPKIYSDLGKFLKKNRIIFSGHPAICSSYLNDTLKFIKAGFIADSVVTLKYLHPIIPVRAVVAKYSGKYENVNIAYKEIESYISLKRLTFNGEIWEEYLNDPIIESDSSKWQTMIYYTIKD